MHHQTIIANIENTNFRTFVNKVVITRRYVKFIVLPRSVIDHFASSISKLYTLTEEINTYSSVPAYNLLFGNFEYMTI